MIKIFIELKNGKKINADINSTEKNHVYLNISSDNLQFIIFEDILHNAYIVNKHEIVDIIINPNVISEDERIKWVLNILDSCTSKLQVIGKYREYIKGTGLKEGKDFIEMVLLKYVSSDVYNKFK